MARRRRRKSSHKNAPGRSRRSHRRSHRRSSRRYHANPMPSKDLMMAIAFGAIGYLAAEALTRQVSRRLPAFVPKPDVVGAALSSALLAYGASYLPVGGDSKRAAQIGAGIPTVKALANAIGLGQMLGTAPIVLLPPPGQGGSALPAPLSAALNAQLEAALANNMEDHYSPDY